MQTAVATRSSLYYFQPVFFLVQPGHFALAGTPVDDIFGLDQWFRSTWVVTFPNLHSTVSCNAIFINMQVMLYL